MKRLLLALPLLLTACAKPADPPLNLLLICIDTIRADVFFRPGVTDELSPWLEQAQVYENALSVAPWTLPTVATILTGLYPIQHGAGALESPIQNLSTQVPTSLAKEAHTLTEQLVDREYATGLFSAHPWVSRDFGLQQGFQRIITTPDSERLVNDLLTWTEGEAALAPAWFGYLHLFDPHTWRHWEVADMEQALSEMPPDLAEAVNGNPFPGACAADPPWACDRSRLYQMLVLQSRQRLADVLNRLKSTGQLEQTVVVFYTDHGEAFRDRPDQHMSLHEDPRDYYNGGHGQYQFQELLHVPLLAWVPGKPGQRHERRVSLVDVYPSIVQWLAMDDIDLDGLAGRSLTTPYAEAGQPRALYASNVAFGLETIAIVADDVKAMYWPGEDRFAFFDLIRDPGEVDAFEDDGLRLQFGTLAGDYLELPRRFDATVSNPDDEALEELKGIGYLQGVEEED